MFTFSTKLKDFFTENFGMNDDVKLIQNRYKSLQRFQ